MQDQDLALFRLQTFEGGAQALQVRCLVHCPWSLPMNLFEYTALSLTPGDMIETHTARHGVQPGAKRRFTAKRARIQRHSQEHVVTQVGSQLLVAHHRVALRRNTSLPALVQRLQMRHVTGGQPT
jgi:hypothetical protein